MNKLAKLAELRHSLARYGLPDDRPSLPLGEPRVDAVLGGGLRRGALHEVFSRDWGASAFGVLLAMKLAAGKTGPLFWVRSDYAALEYGALSPCGLVELGGDPRQLMLIRSPNAADALAAGADILACPHVGALLLEMEGAPRCLDLIASRRLSLAAAESGVTVILLREGAEEEPSAAVTRWEVASLASRENDDDWGNPRFAARLTRHRLGGLGEFHLQWDCDNGCFNTAYESKADSGAVAAAPANRPAEAQRRIAI